MSHIHEKIDFTTEVFIMNQGRVLLRKHDKLGQWLSIGGHIELEHDPVETAHKEVKEEVGLDIELIDTNNSADKEFLGDMCSLVTPRFLNRHRINETHEHIAFVYFATTKNPDVCLPKESYETVSKDEWNWFSKEEIRELDPCPENVRYYAVTALEEMYE